MSSLPHTARQDHILPGLSQHSILSVGQMCDSGCAVTFTATKIAVTNGATTILTGQRDNESGLWRVPLGNSISTQAAPEHYAHNAYEHKSYQDRPGMFTKSVRFPRCPARMYGVYTAPPGGPATCQFQNLRRCRSILMPSFQILCSELS
jgi:hypothetical protein